MQPMHANGRMPTRNEIHPTERMRPTRRLHAHAVGRVSAVKVYMTVSLCDDAVSVVTVLYDSVNASVSLFDECLERGKLQG